MVKKWFSLASALPLTLVIPLLAGCETTSSQDKGDQYLSADGRNGQSTSLNGKPTAQSGAVAQTVMEARNLRQDGNPREAVRLLEEALSATPEYPDLLLELGRARIAAGQSDSAVVALQRYTAAHASDWQGHDLLGVAFDLTGKHAQAQSAYGRALALSPGNSRILNNRAMSYALTGQLDTAAGQLRDAAGRGNAPEKVRGNIALVEQLRGGASPPKELP